MNHYRIQIWAEKPKLTKESAQMLAFLATNELPAARMLGKSVIGSTYFEISEVNTDSVGEIVEYWEKLHTGWTVKTQIFSMGCI